jgi:aryl-alcohol dehydrogenase-like predicted oxidoreductase
VSALSRFRTLGRSGLIVSPLALGTMTFGNTAWGSDATTSAAVLAAYVESGGNFIDTADVYAGGRSEEFVGDFIAERRLRDQLVLATKFTFHAGDDSNVNSGGNGRKNMYRAIDGSLKRLKTDYVDLFWMHAWDRVTPVEEVLKSLGDLVSAGKIRYFAFSDVPAWYAASAATRAQVQNVPGPIALQLEYSLTERAIEREHIPAARELGLGIMPWSPLAAGFLAGKYHRDAEGNAIPAGGRLDNAHQPFRKFTERNWAILDVVRAVATEVGQTPARVALAWAAVQPGITSVILGARTVEQCRENIASADVQISASHLERLDAVSAPEDIFPYPIFGDDINREAIFGGSTVEGWQHQRAGR